MTGTTACKWDSVIPFDEMWERLNKLIKPNGAIVLFGSEPFSSALRMSNIKNYKYDWVWEKTQPTGIATAKIMPLKYHEIVSIFAKKKVTYNKQPQEREWNRKHEKNYKRRPHPDSHGLNSEIGEIKVYSSDFKNPKSLLKFDSVPNGGGKKLHPTQKPVALMEYLIKTYTNEDELVLDFTMGSGTTGVACKNLNRRFIGIELDKEYFEIAQKRIEEHSQQSTLQRERGEQKCAKKKK